MEKWRDFIWQLFFGVLVIFFGGWILGTILNFVAMASPHMVSMVFCPAGSTATHGLDFSQPGANGSTILCQDQHGAVVPGLSVADSVVLQRKYFYNPGSIIMILLVVGWFIWRWMRNQVFLNIRKPGNPGSR